MNPHSLDSFLIKDQSVATPFENYNGLLIFKFDKSNKIVSSYWIQYDNSEKANVSAKTEGNMEAAINEWFSTQWRKLNSSCHQILQHLYAHWLWIFSYF